MPVFSRPTPTECSLRALPPVTARCSSRSAVRVSDALWLVVASLLVSPCPSVFLVDSLSQARPAFPMKALLLSEGVMAQEGSVWRNGGKSLLFPGKM